MSDVYVDVGTTPAEVLVDVEWGVPGPPGPPGGGGGGSGAYRHVQTAPATTWIIVHGLAFLPNVTVVDSSGREIWPGTVTYTNPTTVTLTFSAAVGGEGYLS